MKAHEYRKISKFVDEILLFLLVKDYQDINVDIKITDKKTTLKFDVDNLTDKTKEKLNKRLSRKRNTSIEEYGWELLGESDLSCELDLVGKCFDTYKLVENGTRSTIILERLY